jgi:hypothetical protein
MTAPAAPPDRNKSGRFPVDDLRLADALKQDF